MAEFMIAAAVFILAVTAVGLVRLLRRPAAVDRLMAAQLLGTGGVAALSLLAVASAAPAIVDVALTLALLAAFLSIAFSRGTPGSGEAADP